MKDWYDTFQAHYQAHLVTLGYTIYLKVQSQQQIYVTPVILL